VALEPETVGTQHLAEPGDVDVEGVIRSFRGFALPEVVDQSVCADHVAAADE
jgi:hypothetical protein